MEGSRSYGGSGGDWLADGGSRAEAAGAHVVGDKDQDVGDVGGAPGWLTRGKGSESEVIGEVGGVAQVYVFYLGCFIHPYASAS